MLSQAIIFRNLWKNHRLLPPKGKKKAYWDAVCDALSWSPMLLCGQCVDCALTHDTNITVPPSVANR